MYLIFAKTFIEGFLHEINSLMPNVPKWSNLLSKFFLLFLDIGRKCQGLSPNLASNIKRILILSEIIRKPMVF